MKIEKETLERLINLKLNNKQIALELGVHPDTTRRAIKNHNLKTKTGSGGNNRIVDHNPFLDLENPDVQYWLGFLAADGCISSTKWYFTLHQAGQDRFHVNELRLFISENIKLQTYNNPAGNEVWQIMVGNKEIHKFLIAQGLTPRKSRTLEYLGEFTGHFIRGVFDGDGSCSTNRIPKITTGSELFRDQLIAYFNSLNIKCNWREKGDKNSINPVYDVQILKAGRKLFYDLLYPDASYNYCLERKRLKVEAII
jgi:hypothetical protein